MLAILTVYLLFAPHTPPATALYETVDDCERAADYLESKYQVIAVCAQRT